MAQDSSVPSAPESHNCSTYDLPEVLADPLMNCQWAFVDKFVDTFLAAMLRTAVEDVVAEHFLAARVHTAVEDVVVEYTVALRTVAERNVAEDTAAGDTAAEDIAVEDIAAGDTAAGSHHCCMAGWTGIAAAAAAIGP